MKGIKERGVLGASLIIVGSALSFVGVFSQIERHITILIVSMLVIACDVLLMIGVYFLFVAFGQITAKLLMRDTGNKFLFGFAMFIITDILSIISFTVPLLGHAKWFSLAIASFFFIASILLILALMQFGEALKVVYFKIAAWLFIVLVIVPPYTGAGGLITNFKNIHSIFLIAGMYSFGDVLLSCAAAFLFVGFIKFKPGN